ncbi:MAG: hypothetical protein GC191_19780 [Azospirillum sp.]|nr:hypothetical protein [Azospirillum sp.]
MIAIVNHTLQSGGRPEACGFPAKLGRCAGRLPVSAETPWSRAESAAAIAGARPEAKPETAGLQAQSNRRFESLESRPTVRLGSIAAAVTAGFAPTKVFHH